MNISGKKEKNLLANTMIVFAMTVFIISLLFCTQKNITASETPKEYRTSTGKTIIVLETHPHGQCRSTIEIRTRGFEHDFQEIYPNRNPISDVFVADLDNNGFDEIYIITTSPVFGNYGTVLGFASNEDRSLSMINFPAIQKADEKFEGYMGHDTFKIEGQKLIWIFPIYNKGDTNENPTGVKRKLVYGLYSGEFGWQLWVEQSEKLNVPLNGDISDDNKTMG